MTLKLRKRMKRKKPTFRRQESAKHVRLKGTWRRPRGRHSKLRKTRKARGRRPSPSYSSPKAVRGLNPRGLREVRVFRPEDLKGLDPGKECAVIGGTVGKAKRATIAEKAKALKIRVSNI